MRNGFFLISIHALLAESDFDSGTMVPAEKNFYPRSPCGERPNRRELLLRYQVFLSTLSLRRATAFVMPFLAVLQFLSTLSLRRATVRYPWTPLTSTISIHALLAESDCAVSVQVGGNVYFYPRSPCGERPCILTISICTVLFLSTLSLRRATSSIDDLEPSSTHFYPRSPCGERRGRHIIDTRTKNFYPRSPCGERQL